MARISSRGTKSMNGMNNMNGMSEAEFRLLNGFQRDFPLVSRPFLEIGRQIGMAEAVVLNRLQHWNDEGVISRVGAVFRPNSIGVSTLAAMAVPRERFEDVARYVSALRNVNHNYEREHAFNLWFVATAPTVDELLRMLSMIEQDCGCGPVLYLPMLEEYHIDLGFDLSVDATGKPVSRQGPGHLVQPSAVTLDEHEQKLVAALQDGLPIVPRPFSWLGVREPDALATIARWVGKSIVKRFGIVVRHHELGYAANAMAVWNVPDGLVSDIGRRLADSGRVSLCYRRLRQEPHWSYNLFCMVHGKDRREVQACIDALVHSCGLQDYDHAVLFSTRRFKQCGAHYARSVPQTIAARETEYA